MAMDKRRTQSIATRRKRLTLLPLAALFLGTCGQAPAKNRGQSEWSSTFSTWSSTWNRGSWVVALRRGQTTTDDTLAHELAFELKNNVRTALELSPLPSLEFSNLSQNLDTSPEIISLPKSSRDGSISFAIFNTAALHTRVTSALRMQRFSVREAENKAVELVSSALADLPGSVWVEPDLESKILETPAFPEGDAMEPWERINLTPVYEYIAEKGLQQKTINVAVLDTGVDSLHPALVGQMFENSIEKSGQANVDDDNNGYVDDINGIDATFEKGKRDKGPSPVPGSADLGGPGSPCPIPSFDPLSRNCGHGTHVAGIIAAKPDASVTMAGVCQSCKIISLRVTSRLRRNGIEMDGQISDSSQVRALSYLLNLTDPKDSSRLLVNIVNMSLGKYFKSRSMAFLVRRLQDQNVVVVAAAGNDDTDAPSYPAAYSSVVSVCALGSDGGSVGSGFHRGRYGKAIFSNFGEWVDICAPGLDILSTVPSDGVTPLHEVRSGTSQAAPFVAGSLGLLLSIADTGVSLQTNSLVEIMLRTANSNSVYSAKYNLNLYDKRYPDGTSAYLLGSGIVDLLNAAKVVVGDPSGKRTSEVDSQASRDPLEGCVINSVARRKNATTGLFDSFLFLVPGLWIVVASISRKGRYKKR